VHFETLLKSKIIGMHLQAFPENRLPQRLDQGASAAQGLVEAAIAWRRFSAGAELGGNAGRSMDP
jgi:hypothetical protein